MANKRLGLLERTFGLVLLGAMATRMAYAERMVALKGHMDPHVSASAMIESAPGNEMVPLSLVVRLDQTLLDQTLQDIYGPNAPQPKHFLSSSEFAQKFGLADKRQALKSFAQANGFTVNPADDRDDSLIVKVSAPVTAIQRTFGVHLNRYRGREGQIFRANDTDPIIPASLEPHLGAVLGLSNRKGLMHPHLRFASAQPTSTPKLLGTNGFGGTGLAPADIKSIYSLSGSTLTGTGQSVALFELDGYLPSDITTYENQYGLSHPTLTNVSVDGTSNTILSADDQVEVTLDIEMVAALASGVSQILVYQGPNSGQGIIDIYNQIALDDIAKSVSTSWGAAEDPSFSAFYAAESSLFQRMAVQGQTIYAAAGDKGAFDNGSTLSVDDPASQPYVTGVGGTTLTGSVASPVETTWLSGSGSTGGGVSVIWALPSYQSGVAGETSSSFRNVPDVALNADPNNSPYSIFAGTYTWTSVGGTSAAAPLWAAMTALSNEQTEAAGNGDLGFANPTFYQFGTSSVYSSIFNDVLAGNNGFYTAHAGYDNTTGWGSFKGSGFVTSVNGGLANNIQETLANVFASPNPWNIRTAILRQVKFHNVPSDATVKIYTVSGFWVTTLTASNGNAIWPLTNDKGENVASGLYFYIVATPIHSTKGVIAIIK